MLTPSTIPTAPCPRVSSYEAQLEAAALTRSLRCDRARSRECFRLLAEYLRAPDAAQASSPLPPGESDAGGVRGAVNTNRRRAA